MCQTYSKVPRSAEGDLHFDLELPQRHQKDFIPFPICPIDALDKGPAFDPKMAVVQGSNRNIPFLKPDFGWAWWAKFQGSLLAHRKVNKINGGSASSFPLRYMAESGVAPRLIKISSRNFIFPKFRPRSLTCPFAAEQRWNNFFRDPCVGSFGVSNMMEHDEHVRTKHRWLVVWNIFYFPQ